MRGIEARLVAVTYVFVCRFRAIIIFTSVSDEQYGLAYTLNGTISTDATPTQHNRRHIPNGNA